MKTVITHLAVAGLLVFSTQALAAEVTSSTPERDRKIRIQQANQAFAAAQKARAQLVKKSALLKQKAIAKRKRQEKIQQILKRDQLRREKLARIKRDRALTANKRQQHVALIKRDKFTQQQHGLKKPTSANQSALSTVMTANMGMRAAASALK